MLNKIKTVIATLTLVTPIMTLAGSDGLLLNDDSVQVYHASDTAPLFGVDVHQAYNLLYSQEPDPRNLMLSAELEFPERGWKFFDNHTLTPRLDLMAANFMDHYLTAAAVGASYRIPPGDSHSFDIQAEATLSPQLTTLGNGKYLWTFKTQLNYPLADNVELNFGYRSITMKLLNNYEDGFERGLYFGITTRFE